MLTHDGISLRLGVEAVWYRYTDLRRLVGEEWANAWLAVALAPPDAPDVVRQYARLAVERCSELARRREACEQLVREPAPP